MVKKRKRVVHEYDGWRSDVPITLEDVLKRLPPHDAGAFPPMPTVMQDELLRPVGRIGTTNPALHAPSFPVSVPWAGEPGRFFLPSRSVTMVKWFGSYTCHYPVRDERHAQQLHDTLIFWRAWAGLGGEGKLLAGQGLFACRATLLERLRLYGVGRSKTPLEQWLAFYG